MLRKYLTEVYNFPDTTNLSFNDEIIEDSLATNVSISIYPNPAESLVNIKLDNYKGGEIECAVYDITGKLIFVKEFHSSNIKINVKTFQSGVYNVNVKLEDQILNSVFVKQ